MTGNNKQGHRSVRTRRQQHRAGFLLAVAAAVSGIMFAAAACGSSRGSGDTAPAASGRAAEVTIDLTSQGCVPKPARVRPGPVEFTVTNTGAGAVSEAELRTADLAHILGEQENLTPGLSGGFSLTVQPGSYKISCPGAARPQWSFTVTGRASGPSWQSDPQLAAAVQGYAGYIDQNVADLVSHTQSLCRAIDAGSLTQAQLRYPQARIYYERIEPVAEIWGSLDTQIDGRWENPVTVASKFTGFHKIEQLMWEDRTLSGAPSLCAGLVRHEQQLKQLVNSAQYSPLEMASGATDLINEAATSKITGEEERYSNTDFVVFKANVDGAMEVVDLLTPYLAKADPGLVPLIQRRHDAVSQLLGKYGASPGYDGTGYVEYSTVLDAQRRQLSTAANALAEVLSKISGRLS